MMRISDSQLTGYVSHQSQQNVSNQQTETSQETVIKLNDMQRVTGRQETVNLTYYQYYENEQSSNLYSQSTITNPNSGEQITITQEELTQILVSGILEQDIHIGDVAYTATNSTNISFIEELGLQVSSDNQTASPQSKNAVGNQSNGTASTTEMTVSKQQLLESSETLTLVSEGEITTADGRTISFRLELDLDHRYTELTNQQLNVRSQDLVDPLVISLDGRAPSLTSSTFSFDIDSDGQNENLPQLASGAGFLAIDLNQDGRINNGQELFGPQSGNGYADLEAYDSNNDGWIDESDEVFNQLVVWQPSAIEGEGGNLISIKDAGVGAISLQAQKSPFTITDDHNNTLGVVQRSGVYLKENGEVGLIQQIDLAVQPAEVEAPSTGNGFEEQAEQLAERFQQHLSDNEDQLFQQGVIEFDVTSLTINGGRVSLSESAQPILIIARQFQFESRLQESVVQQQSSFRKTTIEPYEPAQEEDAIQPREVRNAPEFSVDRKFVSPRFGANNIEGDHSIKNSIIESVLKPLHEQLKLQRQRASEEYGKN